MAAVSQSRFTDERDPQPPRTSQLVIDVTRAGLPGTSSARAGAAIIGSPSGYAA
jgi:hypothetical protein